MRSLYLLPVLALGLLIAPASAFAGAAPSWTNGAGGGGGGSVADQTCDSDVWKTMEDRARIETEREIMQNQNLIFKPDSVLTYACFDSMTAHAAKNVGVLFTHTTYWDGKEIIQWGDNGKYVGVDEALKRSVTAAMEKYIQGNFNHDLLGGRGQHLGLQKPNVTQVPSKGADYSCSQMSAVWKVAKCFNFMHEGQFADKDGFYPFKNLRAGPGGSNNIEGYESKNDVREWPEPCTGANPVPNGWKSAYDAGRNDSGGGNYNKNFQYGTPNQQAFEKVRQLIEPGTCGQKILTGVKVILSPSTSGTPKDDAVCSNPGCTYDGSSCTTSGGGGTAAQASNPPGGV